jgi:PAS domain S-box-containing protein
MMLKAAQEALIESELRYRRLFDTAHDGILIVDFSTSLIIDVNPFLLELLGYGRGEIVGNPLWDFGLFKDRELSKSAFLTLKEKHYVRYDDLPLETRDGRAIAVEFVSNVVSATWSTSCVWQCGRSCLRYGTEQGRRSGAVA